MRNKDATVPTGKGICEKYFLLLPHSVRDSHFLFENFPPPLQWTQLLSWYGEADVFLKNNPRKGSEGLGRVSSCTLYQKGRDAQGEQMLTVSTPQNSPLSGEVLQKEREGVHCASTNRYFDQSLVCLFSIDLRNLCQLVKNCVICLFWALGCVLVVLCRLSNRNVVISAHLWWLWTVSCSPDITGQKLDFMQWSWQEKKILLISGLTISDSHFTFSHISPPDNDETGSGLQCMCGKKNAFFSLLFLTLLFCLFCAAFFHHLFHPCIPPLCSLISCAWKIHLNASIINRKA